MSSLTQQPGAIAAVEDLLAHLICADRTDVISSIGVAHPSGQAEQVDISVLTRFEPMKPQLAYTFDALDKEREYSIHPDDLLRPAQEILDSRAEIALICEDRVKWLGFKRLNKLPRLHWCAKPGASLYEMHYREIFASGASSYRRRVVAISKKGEPVIVVAMGSLGNDANQSAQIVLAASIIEDAHRVNAMTATISDAASIRLPVPVGEHKALFALRDAPMTSAGRRRAILHWVAQHTRKTGAGETSVAPHWRGTRELTVDGMTVTLATNDGPSRRAA